VHTNEQLYSMALNKFLADRYVTGTCPKCGYEDARGDQCDACSALLNPVELKNPKCKFSGTAPVMRETSHVYIDLPQLAEPLEEYVRSTSSQV
jgi:methionyl-tRNA synthetase